MGEEIVFFLSAAKAGWGAAVGRVLFPKARADLGLCSAWGMAAVIAIGGALNLAGWISARSVLCIVAMGLAWLAAGWRRLAAFGWPAGGVRDAVQNPFACCLR